MTDRNLVKELKRWATEEFNLPPDSLPNESYLKTLCVGTGKSIWKYMIQHVFQQRTVRIMRGNLQWYKTLQDKELMQAEGQSEAAKRKELQTKIEQLRDEISHLDSQIRGTEEQMATQERSINRIWVQIEEDQTRELLLKAFRQRSISNRTVLSDDVQKINDHRLVLEQMARKAESEVLFDDEPSNLNSKAAAVPQVLRELRELSEDRVHFFRCLQENEVKVQQSAPKSMPREQRTAVFQYWLSTSEKVLSSYPPSHVLSALQHLAVTEQKALQDQLASLDVAQDVAALRFRFESDHLLDISAEECDELPPVQTLLEAAWAEVQQSFTELSQTRSRIQQLKTLLKSRKAEAEQEVSGIADENLNESLALSTLEVELQCVMQAAARDHIRERCIQLDQHARNRQEALRSLRSQWQNILDFRNLVALRQEQLRGLIKGNSSAKTQLISVHRELQEFIEAKLVPQFEDVIGAANNLRNSVSKEAKQFGTISLLALDHRTMDGMHRVPASWLSIHRLQASNFSSLHESLKFPLYKAPEELCFQLLSQQLELRFLRELLQLYSATLQKVEKDSEQLHASDQKALLSKVREADQKLLKSLLPTARGLTNHCAQGLSYGAQVKTAISYWWDKPAQHVLPELSKGGLTFQQWLQRWKLKAKAS
ncbi:HAUS augmin-like complex subunit 5 [Poecilia reticulata]|uniref:HAUS augmin-like complex, subunit 5 n=1 Tax=Poecilia reticulata TaxID=8081 RepID=A0A3P9PW85_POERE|nr:PREDICTED: HAUS augmin-like complex subunit 5 [Poecilia reticulata]